MITELFNIRADIIMVLGIDNNLLANYIVSNAVKMSYDITSTAFEDSVVDLTQSPDGIKLLEQIENIAKERNLVFEKDYWTIIHRQFEACGTHNHDGDYSFVYYVHVPAESGKLIFVLDEFDKRQPCYIHEPMESQLVIFPSFLKHKVSKNMSADYRISVSGNFSIKKN
ncbi:Conserved hypothetical protein CHP02466 [uncultured Caudovirales phage]|uniref:Uncharacterized protein n=1 Tax=uncultured Caudovirales phage TaxID=2100421 RepID=A0A6J5TAM7_9CAUD|nr:Conserved hypothetical protein CHP02466 [uncultured Caudovirales phage]CAB4242036.1 Conserved hypothetical protein CHP02466 [uncultured Caudovirales phage]